MKEFIELTVVAHAEDNGTKALFAVRTIERVLPPHDMAEGNVGACVMVSGHKVSLDVAEAYDAIKAELQG